jgi:Gluconate 2-dehydrogenase subunit 3
MAEPFRSLYPHYDVLAKWTSPSWNDPTRKVVGHRLTEVPSRRFFTEDEWATLEAVCDRIMPQPERPHPVPIVPWIDLQVHEDRGTGTRYAGLPPQKDCWRFGIAAIDAEARLRHGRPFRDLDPEQQDLILQAMDEGKVEAPEWERVPSRMFMRHVLLRRVVEVYYAHPAAWSEIGFGGPASPRGYVRLGADRRDSWEGEEDIRTPLRRARG